MQQFCIKTKILSGSGALEAIGAMGLKKACLFCDPFLVSSGGTNQLTEMLRRAGTALEIFSDIVPDPSRQAVYSALEWMVPLEPDSVIALGGGSTLDLAKAAVFFYPQVTQKSKPLCIAVPATSGTGSECTSFAILSDPERDMKDPLIDERILPDYAVLDAQFTRSMPPQVTADTGLDALVHAVESYVSSNAQEFTDALCEKAARLIFTYLPRAFSNPDDMEAREKMHCAACLAGMSFSQTGLGITHGMAHALGGSFHLTHGRSCALLLPAVIEFNARLDFGSRQYGAAAVKYAELASALWGNTLSVPQGVGSLMRGIRRLCAQVGVPERICHTAVKRLNFMSRLDAMSAAAALDASAASNPRAFTADDLRALLLASY